MPAPDPRSPMIVAGMHRSGTSLVASLAAGLGVDLGDRLLAADSANPRGYFEDLDFLGLHRRMLLAATAPDDGGHRDWGWTESGRLEGGGFDDFRGEAHALLAARAGAGRAWGFKDPRATLLLDFWASLAPASRFVLVYRLPWEVADSMQRLGAEVFLRRPDYAYRIWEFYNRRLLDFRRRAGDRALLISVNALVQRPERLGGLLRERFGFAVREDERPAGFAAELFRSLPADDPLGGLAAAAHPDCAALLAELDTAADLSGADSWRPAPLRPRHPEPPAPAVSVVIPCYEHGEFLIEAIASVERAMTVPYELIVVDDGSRAAGTLAVLDTLRRAGYRILAQDHSGLAAARNRGVAAARAEVILPLDADNRLRAGFVEEALQVLQQEPRVGAVYGDRWELGLRSGRVEVGVFDLARLICGNYIDAFALTRKSLIEECGGYDERMPLPGAEDWDLWLSAVERGWELRRLDRVAFDYRVRPESVLTQLSEPGAFAQVQRYVLAKHHQLYFDEMRQLLLSLRAALAAPPSGKPPEGPRG